MVDTATPDQNAPPKFDLNTMSNDDILGPEPKVDLSKQTNDDILGPEPSAWQSTKSAIPYLLGGGGTGGAVARDQFFRGTSAGRILNAFGQGAADNWGSDPVGLSDDAQKWMKDVGLTNQAGDNPWHSPIKAFNRAIFQDLATAWDVAQRSIPAAIGAIGSGVGQTAEEMGASPTTNEQLSQDINILPFALGDAAISTPRPGEQPLPKVIQDAHDLNVIGPEGEAGWKGSPVAAPEAAEEVKGQTPEQQAAIADTKEATQAAETDKSAPQAPAQAPSIDDVARKIDPGTMDQWQSLNTRRDTYRQWISDLSEQQLAKAAENSPFADTIRNLTDQIAETQAKMEDATPRLAKKYQARIDDFQSQLEDAQAKHDDYMQNAMADSGDVARVRQALMKTDYAMRDMAPQISDLYRQAQAQMGGEEAPVAPVAEQPQAAPEQPPVAAEQPAQAPAPQEPAKIAPVPAEAVPAAGEPSNVVGKETLGGASKETLGLPDQRAQIEKDVVDKLTKAGRPADEANAAAALISARYETRAERFGGAKGNALDLYKATAPDVRRGGRATAPVAENEFAQGRLPESSSLNTPRTPTAEEMAASSRVESVNLSDVRGTQPKMDWEKFNKGEHPPALIPGYEDMPIAVRREDGEFLIFDGHHRAAKAIEDGKSSMDMHVIDAKDYDPENAGRKPAASTSKWTASDDDLLKELGIDLSQGKRGTIRLQSGQRPVIRLMQDADASTFMHETGHAWLEELMSDAKEEGVHESVKQDAQTVRDWIGNDGGDLTRAQHEKFAKGFEQYLFTGQAPNAGLAGVFRQFRDWLSSIYNAVSGRGVKISDDIRDVFDRLIAVNPERQPLLTNEPPAKTLADLHELDAEHSPAEVAAETGHNIEAEMGNTARPPVDEDISERARGSGSGAENSATVAGAGEEAGDNEPGGRGGPAASSAVGGGTGKGASEGAGAREGAGTAEGERNEGETATLAPPKTSGLVSEVPTSAHQQFEPPQRPEQYFDKAGNIRLENLNRPEDIKAVLRDVADQNGGFEIERGGVKSLVEQQAAADALGLNPKDFNPNRPDGVSESTWLRAVKDLTLRSATDVRDLMVKARDSGEDADAAALGKALARHQMIQAEFSRAKAESGRALAANRWDDARALVEGAGRMAEEATGMTLNQLKQMAQDGAAMETPAQVSKFVNDASKPGLRDKIQFVALNGLISGPVTHMTYEIASMLTVLEESLLERPIAAAYGTARDLIRGEQTPGRVYWGEVGPTLYGAYKGGRDGVRAALDAWKSNITSPLPGEELAPGFDKRMGTHPEPPIGGALGTVIGVPGRVVTAMHSFNRNVFYAMNIQSMAARMANDLGLTGDAAARKIADLTTSPTEDMMKASIDYANGMAYMKKPEFGSAMYHIEKFSNSNLATKLMLPFTRVAANIIDRAYVERTPIGLLKGKIRDDLMGRNGPAAADFARARMTAGVLIGGALTGLALDGMATGSGPTNANERQLWLVDHQPYSVRVGDTWVPYKRLGHIGMLMGLGANIAETIHTYDDKDAEHAVVQLAHGIASNVVDESWMAGVSNVLKMIDDPSRAKGYAFSTASELVPFSAFMRQSANALDPYAREARGFEAEAQNMVPIWRQGLPPRRNVWGEPIPSSQSAPFALAASPFQSMIRDDPTTAEMERIETYPARAGRKIRGVELDPQQYDDYARVSGRLMKARLDQITQSPGWAQMPDGIKQQVAKKIIDGSREAARSTIMMQYPDIIDRAVAAKRQSLQ